jgi:PadR family transcriptional regulator, regulatory protein PadR
MPHVARRYIPWRVCSGDWVLWKNGEADRRAALPLTSQRSVCYSFGVAKGEKMDVLQGTLDLMVLQTLDSMGPLHGYGLARRIEQISDDILKLNEGTVYASLTRLRQRHWISASWGASENNRKAKFYAITKAGRRQLAAETENWERISTVIGRLLRSAGRG